MNKLKWEKYVNRKYGKLLVKEVAYRSHGAVYVKCLCDCGKESNIRLNCLNQGQIKCKGCYKAWEHPNWRGHGEISKNVYSIIERNALSRGLEFNVSIEYLWELFLKQNRKCELTNVDITFAEKDADLNKSTTSLDRINSKIGYIEGNVQWVHKAINHIKSNVENEVFILICNLVSNKKTSILKEEDFTNNYKCLIKNNFNGKIGANHHRSKSYELINESGSLLIVKGLENYCKENNLNIESMKKTFDLNNFHKGWKINKKL